MVLISDLKNANYKHINHIFLIVLLSMDLLFIVLSHSFKKSAGNQLPTLNYQNVKKTTETSQMLRVTVVLLLNVCKVFVLVCLV